MPSVHREAHRDRTLDLLQLEKERAGWFDLSARGLARAYGDSEPEYSAADLLGSPL